MVQSVGVLIGSPLLIVGWLHLTFGGMKHLLATENELNAILVWESSFLSLTDDQKSLCVALHRNLGPIDEVEFALLLNCTVEDLRNLQRGIWGILIDSSTRKYWIK